jgi:hypothetical protein
MLTWCDFSAETGVRDRKKSTAEAMVFAKRRADVYHEGNKQCAGCGDVGRAVFVFLSFLAYVSLSKAIMKLSLVSTSH